MRRLGECLGGVEGVDLVLEGRKERTSGILDNFVTSGLPS